MLLTCAYRGAEFFRVGYYVNNELATPPVADAEGGMDDEVPPPTDPNLLIRNILVDQPRVTRFSINWE
jgi:histone chaperone ASF1